MVDLSLIEKLEAVKQNNQRWLTEYAHTAAVHKTVDVCIAIIRKHTPELDVVDRALRYAREIAPTPAAVELYDKAIAAMNMGELHTEPKGNEAKRNECDCLRRPDSEGMPASENLASPANSREMQLPGKPTEAMCDEAKGFILGLDLGIRNWQDMEKHLDRGGYYCIPYIREMAAQGQGGHITKWDVADCIWQLMARALSVPTPAPASDHIEDKLDMVKSEIPVIDKALENAAFILANFKPEGERDKLDEWQACYAMLFKQMNDLVNAHKPVSVSLQHCARVALEHQFPTIFTGNLSLKSLKKYEAWSLTKAILDAARVKYVD